METATDRAASFRRRREQISKMTPAEKLRDGPRLFDLFCERLKELVRDQHPLVKEKELNRLTRERVERLKRDDDGSFLFDPDFVDPPGGTADKFVVSYAGSL